MEGEVWKEMKGKVLGKQKDGEDGDRQRGGGRGGGGGGIYEGGGGGG